MIRFSKETLPAIFEEFKALFGPSFFENELARLNRRPGPLHQHVRAERIAHPAMTYYDSFATDVDRLLRDGYFSLAPNTLFAIKLLSDTSDIQTLANAGRIIDRLRNASTFRSAAFEAAIATEFKHISHSLEIVEEGASKSMDLLQTAEDGGCLWIECKCLEHIEGLEYHLWHELLAAIEGRLMKRKRSWQISIFAERYVTGNDTRALRQAIEKAIDQDCLGYFDVEDLGFQCVQIGNWDEWRDGPMAITTNARTDLVNQLCQMKMFDGKMQYKNAVVACVSAYQRTNETRRIAQVTKAAAAQAVPGELNCVYIELPYRDGARLVKIAADAYAEIQELLSRNHTRISCVVLVGLSIAKNHIADTNPMLGDFYVIPNPAAAKRCGPNNRIAGTLPSAGFSLSKSGAVELDLTISNPLNQQIGRTIFYRTSSDGFDQFRIWQTFNNSLRFDITLTPGFRLAIETRDARMRTNAMHSIRVEWNERGGGVSLDGERLKSTFEWL